MITTKRLPLLDAPSLTALENNQPFAAQAYGPTPASEGISWSRYQMGLLIFVQQGATTVITESKSVVASPGLLVYVPPGLAHQQQTHGASSAGWRMNVPATMTSRWPQELGALQGAPSLLALLEKIVTLSPVEVSDPAATWTTRLAMELTDAPFSTTFCLPLPAIPSLRTVAQKIIQAPDDMNSLDHWAKEAAMSRRSFTRHFNKETGLSFVLWRQLAKVYAAVRPLSEGKTVKQVAAEMGYKDSSTFIALFRKTFGTSPKKYSYTVGSLLSKKKLILLTGLLYELIDGLMPQIQSGAEFVTGTLTSLPYLVG